MSRVQRHCFSKAPGRVDAMITYWWNHACQTARSPLSCRFGLSQDRALVEPCHLEQSSIRCFAEKARPRIHLVLGGIAQQQIRNCTLKAAVSARYCDANQNSAPGGQSSTCTLPCSAWRGTVTSLFVFATRPMACTNRRACRCLSIFALQAREAHRRLRN